MERGARRRLKNTTGPGDVPPQKADRASRLRPGSHVTPAPSTASSHTPPTASPSSRTRRGAKLQAPPDPPASTRTRRARKSSDQSNDSIISEIIVHTDDVEAPEPDVPTRQGTASSKSTPGPQSLSKQLLSAMSEQQGPQPSFTSSMSVMSDQSDLSSLLSSVYSSKATTPFETDGPKDASAMAPPAVPAEDSTTLLEAGSKHESLEPPRARSPPTAPEPVEPVEPIEAARSVDTTEPMRPVDTVESIDAVDAVETVDTVEPVNAVEPVAHVESVELVELVKSTETVETIESAQPSEPPQPTEPTQPFEPPHTCEPRHAGPPTRPPKFKMKLGQNKMYDVRPKVSIPADISPQEYAIQCIGAAESSRLNPYALHQDEYHMLRDHISHVQITTYLNIRNGILRLWVRNPTFSVTREEAVGCAKDSRWFDVANVCFDWLVREGYINFGCCEVRISRKHLAADAVTGPSKTSTVVVIGAGLSGLGCARQLQSLFAQYSRRFRERGEQPPKVVVLEGRSRVGGRVYSRPFRTKPVKQPDAFRGKRYTAEMGGMIITGFDRGNPINILVRGQLGLAYHALRSDATLVSIYDSNGRPVDTARDQLVEKLYNDCLDRVSEYKWKLPLPKLLEGKRDLIDEGKDSWAEVHKTISYVEETTAAQPHAPPVAEQNIAPRVDLVPVSSDKVTGKIQLEPGTPGALKASYKAKMSGWSLKRGVSEDADIDLDAATEEPGATLGSVLDEAILQYKDLVDLCPQDMRLLNWHIANLEYSNASNLNQLSLKGWDIDAGNEWEGKHTMIVGGYQSLALGLAEGPAPLDIKFKKAVKSVKRRCQFAHGDTSLDSETSYTIECDDGSTIDADFVVNTIPLGVLKHGDIEFNPPLPSWKTEAIERLGFGVLNKVILVYKEPFWHQDKDIFGFLRQATTRASLHPKDYSRRGRFFQWFNVTNTSGMPTLLALMAGDAAFDTENTPNDVLVAEATVSLRAIFGASVPEPIESIVTRWASDRFARGSYSSAGPRMQLDDYDLMSRPVEGRHFFAGEHTTASHPATVHGAYLSGLRAAGEVLNAMLGPIEVQTPLIVPRETSTTSSLLKRKSTGPRDARKEAEEAWEVGLWEHTRSVLGEYPVAPPAKMTTKAHLLFSRARFDEARQRCLDGRRPGKAPPTANEVRTMASKMWNATGEDERRPFMEQVAALKEVHARSLEEFAERARDYGQRAEEVAAAYEKDHPRPTFPDVDVKEESGGFRTPVNGASASVSVAASPSAAGAGERVSKKAMIERNSDTAGVDGDVEMTG